MTMEPCVKTNRIWGGMLAALVVLVSLSNAVLFVSAQKRHGNAGEVFRIGRQGHRTFPGARPIVLTEYYNFRITNSPLAHNNTNYTLNLADLPLGVTNLAGVRFMIGGIIQLASKETLEWRNRHPTRMDSIGIGNKCKRVHLLHGTGFYEKEGTPVAMLVLHYATGEERKLPIVYGRHVRDWFQSGGYEPATEPNTEVAWTGKSVYAKAPELKRRLYRTAFENPLPDVEIRTVDYVSLLSKCAPFACAISVE